MGDDWRKDRAAANYLTKQIDVGGPRGADKSDAATENGIVGCRGHRPPGERDNFVYRVPVRIGRFGRANCELRQIEWTWSLQAASWRELMHLRNDTDILLMQTIFALALHRVAQIKIPRRTKCNFSTTVWDFYTQICWFIWDPATTLKFKKNILVFSKVMAI